MALYGCMISIHDYVTQRRTLRGGTDFHMQAGPVQAGHDQPESTVYGVFTAAGGCLVIAAQVDDARVRLARLTGSEALTADKCLLGPASQNANRLDALALVRDGVLHVEAAR